MRRWLLDVTRRPVLVTEVREIVTPEIAELRSPPCAERTARSVTHLTRRREAWEGRHVGSLRDRGGARVAQ
jgi:hypothetical protein